MCIGFEIVYATYSLNKEFFQNVLYFFRPLDGASCWDWFLWRGRLLRGRLIIPLPFFVIVSTAWRGGDISNTSYGMEGDLLCFCGICCTFAPTSFLTWDGAQFYEFENMRMTLLCQHISLSPPVLYDRGQFRTILLAGVDHFASIYIHFDTLVIYRVGLLHISQVNIDIASKQLSLQTAPQIIFLM